MSEEQIKMYVEIIEEQTHQTKEEILQWINLAKIKYGIPIGYYMNQRLYGKGEEVLEEHQRQIAKNRLNYQKRICEITGMSMEETIAYSDWVYSTFQMTEKSILDNELYRKSEEEIRQLKEKKKKEKEERISRIMEKTGKDVYWVKKHIAKCKAVYGIAVGNYENTRCYELSDEQLATYANLEDSRYLGKKYITANQEILNDKIIFNQTYKEFLGRDYWINRDTSLEEFRKFVQGKKQIFCKPVDLHGAFGVSRREVSDNIEEMYQQLMKEPKLLVEEVIQQHEAMKEFYANSINTVRVFTILVDDKFDAFASFVRFGVDGIADNIAAGGIGCGVDEKTGIIITPAMGKDGIIYEHHPVTGKKFVGFQIPFWDTILETTERALRLVEGINYVGWDIAITENGISIVEGNSVPCLSIYQSFFVAHKEGRKYKYEKYL